MHHRNREQFHDFRIGERFTAYSPMFNSFYRKQSAQTLANIGCSGRRRVKQAYRMIQASVKDVLSWHIAKAFWLLGVIFLVCFVGSISHSAL